MKFSKKLRAIKDTLGVSQKDLAERVGVSQNAISQYLAEKRSPDLITINKLIEFGVSPMYLLYNQGAPFDECFNSFKTAHSFGTNEELKETMESYILEREALQEIANGLESIKGKDLFFKMFELWHGDGERMTLIFYYFLKHLDKQEISFNSMDIKRDFLKALNEFNIPEKHQKKHLYTLEQKDKDRLTQWINSNLDNVAIFDIVSNSEKISTKLKRRTPPLL